MRKRYFYFEEVKKRNRKNCGMNRARFAFTTGNGISYIRRGIYYLIDLIKCGVRNYDIIASSPEVYVFAFN